MAAAVLGPAAAVTSPGQWPALLASEISTSHIQHDVVEVVIRDGRRPLPSVTTIRIARDDFDGFIDRYLRSLAGTGPVTVGDDALAAATVATSHDAGTLTLEIL